jgi:hypothetical protein
MQDIKEAEAESVQDLTNFLDAELEYHERCAEELRRVRASWPASGGGGRSRQSDLAPPRRPSRRSSISQSINDRNDRTERWASRQDIYEDEELAPEPVRMPVRPGRSGSIINSSTTSISPPRPSLNRSSTYNGASFEGPRDRPSYREPPRPAPALETPRTLNVPVNVGSLRSNLRPVSRIATNQSGSDIFADGYDTNTSSGSPDYDRSESPATSYGSLSRTTSSTGIVKKAPPPPPPSRAKKPPPPIPQKREMTY